MPRLRPPYQYVIDTSALIDLNRYYPLPVFPGVWERLDDMFEQRLIIAPREVYREIKKGNDDLLEWSKDYEDNFLEPVQNELEILQEVMAVYPQRIKVKMGTGVWADPLVIACARHYNLPIVQHEISGDPNQFKIPTVAGKFKIECHTILEFFQQENWTFIAG